MQKRFITSIAIAGYIIVSVLFTACKKNDPEIAGGAPSIESFTPTQGGSTTEMLINGKNFSADTSKLAVSINGRRLKIIASNDHQIMAIVPKKTGSGSVTVTVGGQSATSTDVFTYQYVHVVSTLAGSGTPGFANGNGTNAEFHFYDPVNNWIRASGIVVDRSLNVYVTDAGNNCIRKIDSAGNVSVFAGSPGNPGHADGKGTGAKFYWPFSLGLDADDNVYCVDAINWDIRKITPDGTATTIAWTKNEPWNMTVNKATGDIYYSNIWASQIYQLKKDQSFHDVIAGGFTWATGLACDPDGNIYTVGMGNQAIWKIEANTWKTSIIAGAKNNEAGYVNGIGTAARFTNPWGLAADDAGNLYVAGNGTGDGGANADQSIRFIKADTREVSTFAGSGTPGFTNGVGGAATFSGPIGVAVDKNGAVYVLDKTNNAVRKIVSE
ncbi:IPT/TIG domain-containing protein [Niabella sp.]|uniref:IPT/TIG domain-containing protein n=1 Tax=Niabella sp. TaxID=1962976 RepID=UPI002626B15B|nr:IPT/TIG domain-containing protein [Niabella sp.]